MKPKISAIICTYNRADYLRKAIRSLINQTLPSANYEIIVIDNNSNDHTREVAQEFKTSGVKYIYESKQGLSHARNTGWKNAKGEYVAYLDDDAVADNKWLQNIVQIFETVKPKPGCVAGKVEPLWEIEKPEWLSENMLGQLSLLDLSQGIITLSKEQEFVGANFSVAKKILEEIGGFQTNLGRKGNKLLSKEEVLLKEEIEKRGYRCIYSPQVKIKHYIPKSRLTKKWFLQRAYWNGASSALMKGDIMKVKPAKKIFKSITTILRILLSPKAVMSVFIPCPNLFATKCSVYARVGHVLALWGLVR